MFFYSLDPDPRPCWIPYWYIWKRRGPSKYLYKQGGALYDTCNCQINHDKTHLFFTSCIGLHVCMCCQIRLNFTYSSSISAVFPIISQSKQTISKSNHIIMLRKLSFKAQLFSSHSFWQRVERTTFSCLTRDYDPVFLAWQLWKWQFWKLQVLSLWIFFVVYLIRFLWYTKY